MLTTKSGTGAARTLRRIGVIVVLPLLVAFAFVFKDFVLFSGAKTRQPAVSLSQGVGQDGPIRVARIIPTPTDFVGNVTFVQDENRLFLTSLGPPANTKGASWIYELDPESGKVLREAKLPFLGEFGAPTYLDGVLYVAIYYKSLLYRISARADDSFGRIIARYSLPTMAGIDTNGKVYRFPFINFVGMTWHPDGDLVLYAKDLGQLFFIDPKSGSVKRHISSMAGLSSIAAVVGPRKEFLLIGAIDQRQAAFEAKTREFMFRAAEGLLPSNRYGTREIFWVLMDGESGEVLASTHRTNPPEAPTNVAMVKQEKTGDSPYGRLTFFALGKDGIMEMEWVPG